jgi:hypothetical protein
MYFASSVENVFCAEKFPESLPRIQSMQIQSTSTFKFHFQWDSRSSRMNHRYLLPVISSTIDIFYHRYLLPVMSCIVDSATIYIMVVKFGHTIFPPPPQLSLHTRAALTSNSNGTRSVYNRNNPKSSLYCEVSMGKTPPFNRQVYNKFHV